MDFPGDFLDKPKDKPAEGASPSSGAQEEDLMRAIDQKADELSSFLDESNPAPGGQGSGPPGQKSQPVPPLGAQAELMEAMGVQMGTGAGGGDFDLMGGNITQELISAAKDFGKESPTDFGFERVDQAVPSPRSDPILGGIEGMEGFGFTGTQSEPAVSVGLGGLDLGAGVGIVARTESPRVPEQPCFQPAPGTQSGTGKLGMEEDPYGFGISEKKTVPESQASFTKEASPGYEEYSRRETFCFQRDEEAEQREFEQFEKALSGSAGAPPPVPKHGYEMELERDKEAVERELEEEVIRRDSPPPIPKHADESLQQRPFVHASYDDKIEDEFEDDSLSRPLSHKLSDSLEVLKESPQREGMEESLMDLDSLHSSSSNKGGNGIPQEMLESTLFSQQQPADFGTGLGDQEEMFAFTSAPQEVESAKPVASIPPFGGIKDDIPMQPNKASEIFTTKEKEPMFGFERKTPSPQPPPPTVSVTEPKVESVAEVKPIVPPPRKTEPEPIKKVEEKKQEVKKASPPPAAPPKVPERRPAASAPVAEMEISEEVKQILNTFNPRAWFDPAKLHPKVSELVYWRDPKKSGAAFGAIFVVLIALTCLSLISVIAYTSLAVLSGTFLFRVYKAVMQAVQKTSEGHPFKEYLDLDIALSGEKAQELSNAIINYANAGILKLRRLFLVEDFVDSAKFGVFLYVLTYIGGWFNGLTLIILSFLAMFSLPKVYETNKTVIDQYIDLVMGKVSEINAKVTAALPFLKKEKAQ